MGKLIDKLLWEEGSYPFSTKYNFDKVITELAEKYPDFEVDITTHSIVQFSDYFNVYFKEIGAALKKVLSPSQLNNELFVTLLIAGLNRIEIIISKDTELALDKLDTFDLNFASNTYIQKPEFQNGSEPSWGIIDGAIDTTILNLNYLKYVKFPKNAQTISDELAQVDVIRNMTTIGSAFHSIKSAYDRIIWNYHSIEWDGKSILLKQDPERLMLDNAGLTRLSRNIVNKHMELEHNLSKFPDLIKRFHKSRTFQELKAVGFVDGNLKVQYKARKSGPSFAFLGYVSSFLTFYPFYETTKFRTLDDLTIFDLVNLFSLLHDLVTEFPFPDYEDTEVRSIEKFLSFNPKMEREELVNYFKQTTKYTKNQINVFIDLLVQKGDHYDLYQYPVFEEGKCVYFSLSIMKRANMLYLIDQWLEKAGYDLSKRGFDFEDYITNFLDSKKPCTYAEFERIKKTKFSFVDESSNKVEEEIDLVIKIGRTILIAEVKCITYPLESKDFYSSYQTLKKAQRQVDRKAEFIRENWEHFKSDFGNVEDFKIEKLIVTNFPHFSGNLINGIPVADFYLFLSYFMTGKYTTLKIEKGKKPVDLSIEYYDSVESFETNIGEFFKKPISIYDVVGRQEIESYEVTIGNVVPKVFAQRVVYHPRQED